MMFSRVGCRHIKSPKGRILGNTSSIIGVSVVVLKIGTLLRVENFPGASVLLLDFDQGAYFPEGLSNGFEELILTDGQTQIFAVFLEHFLIDNIRSRAS